MAWSRPDGVRGGHLDLAAELKRLDGKGYKAYKDLGGGWELPLETSTAKISCILFMDHVQGDPYAAPSRMRLRISRKDSAIPTETTENRARRVALEDYLTRVADRMAGRSGVRVDVGGQEVLPRTSCMVNGDFAEFRLAADLPAKGRRIKGGEARRLLLEDLPEVATSGRSSRRSLRASPPLMRLPLAGRSAASRNSAKSPFTIQEVRGRTSCPPTSTRTPLLPAIRSATRVR